LQEKLLQNLTDEDFLLGGFSSTGSKQQPKKPTLDEYQSQEIVKLDLSKLSKKEKLRLFQRESPEFTTVVEDYDERIRNGG
jgi:U3 small nucleolar RNA-associated protein 3